METIVKAAIRVKYKIYTGFEHGECFKKLQEDGCSFSAEEIEQGFIDSKGNFVDRKQAMIIAKEAGQVGDLQKETLISEDLHLDWLRKQWQQIIKISKQLAEYQQYFCELPYPKVRILGKSFEDIDQIVNKWKRQGDKELLERVRHCLSKALNYNWEEKVPIMNVCHKINGVFEDLLKEYDDVKD